jgi:branched-chain amino acid aminotransferase
MSKNINFNIEINPEVILNVPEQIEFGKCQVPLLLSCEITQDNPWPSKVMLNSDLEYTDSPFSSVIHYGQSIFEGLKAYLNDQGEVGIFRLKDHAQRFKRSAEIMGMPAFSEELFEGCLKTFVKACKPYIPNRPGISLYLRPLLVASDPVIKVRSSESYKFLLMGAIVGPYFTGGKEGAKVYCNQEFVRAFPHGTGEAKTAANYALSLPGMRYIQKHGYEQILYLDSQTKSQVDELGGMNFFMIKDNAFITPKLNGTILHGITRKSVLAIADHLGIKTMQRNITLEEVLGENEGIFACGTAATLVPIIELGFEAKKGDGIKPYRYPINPKIKQVRDYLESTHKSLTEHAEQWLTRV